MGEQTELVTTDRDRAFMKEVIEALGALQPGDISQSLMAVEALWKRAQAPHQSFVRCTLAHIMADLQGDAASELAWDLRALAAADCATAEEIALFDPTVNFQAFYPSLHLNVADAALRSGDKVLARRHADLALAAARALPNDGYGRTIRGAIARLLVRVAEAL